jgi:hypothetical protein
LTSSYFLRLLFSYYIKETHWCLHDLYPQVADLAKPVKLDYKQRQEAAIQRDLKAINDLLDTAKSTKGRGFGECWPAPLNNADLGLTMMPGGRAAAVAATLRAGEWERQVALPKTILLHASAVFAQLLNCCCMWVAARSGVEVFRDGDEMSLAGQVTVVAVVCVQIIC